MFEKIFYLIKDEQENIIASTLKIDKLNILDYIENDNQIIIYETKKYRVGKIVTEKGTIYAISNSKDIIKSSRQFKSFLFILKDFLYEFNNTKKLIRDTITKQFNILVHNLISINAHNIQEIYNIIPQEELYSSIPNKQKFIKNKIKTNLDATSIALLKIMKNNNAIKSEFSVYKKLFTENPKLNFKNHNIHRVLMNIFYSFFPEFTDKNIKVNVNHSQLKAFFDYESIHIAFFHIIENATKYIQPSSQFDISFKDFTDNVEITFSMNSLIIEQNELDKLFIEGYSGLMAKKIDKQGNGIGMSRVKKIVELNGGNIRIKIGKKIDKKYQKNTFIISLKKDISIDNKYEERNI